MKKLALIFSSLAIFACGNQIEEENGIDVTQENEVITLDNYNNTGVKIRLTKVAETRAFGVYNEYDVASEYPNGVVLTGYITVEKLSFGVKVVALYRLDDFVDATLIGSYAVDENNKVRGVGVGEPSIWDITSKPINIDLSDKIAVQKNLRLVNETYWQCVRREYKAMKEAYQNRPVDDIVCDMIDPICKALAFVSAAYECRK